MEDLGISFVENDIQNEMQNELNQTPQAPQPTPLNFSAKFIPHTTFISPIFTFQLNGIKIVHNHQPIYFYDVDKWRKFYISLKTNIAINEKIGIKKEDGKLIIHIDGNYEDSTIFEIPVTKQIIHQFETLPPILNQVEKMAYVTTLNNNNNKHVKKSDILKISQVLKTQRTVTLNNRNSSFSLKGPTTSLVAIKSNKTNRFRLRFGRPTGDDLVTVWSDRGELRMDQVRKNNEIIDRYCEFWETDFNRSKMTTSMNFQSINFDKVKWLNIEFENQAIYPVELYQRYYTAKN